MATNESAIDIAALFTKYPKGSPHQRLRVLTDLHQHDLATLRRFWLETRIARGATMFTRPRQELTAENLTRQEWRRLLEAFGVDAVDVGHALGTLGFGV